MLAYLLFMTVVIAKVTWNMFLIILYLPTTWNNYGTLFTQCTGIRLVIKLNESCTSGSKVNSPFVCLELRKQAACVMKCVFI